MCASSTFTEEPAKAIWLILAATPEPSNILTPYFDVMRAHESHAAAIRLAGCHGISSNCLAGMEKIVTTQKLEDKWIGRVVVDCLRRVELLNSAFVHDRNPIRHLKRLFLVVGDKDGRHMDRAVQFAQPAAELAADSRVEGAKRFVEQKDARLDRERTGERHALPLPAGKLGRIALREVLQLNELQKLADLGADFRLLGPSGARASRAARRRRSRKRSCA